MSVAILLAFALSHIAVWVINRGQKNEAVESASWDSFLKGYRRCAIGKAAVAKGERHG